MDALIRTPARVGAVLLALGLVAGCGGLPHTSGVRRGAVIDNHAPATVGNIEYPGPTDGAGPKDIVSGFLDATAGTNSNYDRAREYLTASADRSWQPRSVTIIGDSRDVMVSGPAAVTASAGHSATLDPTSHLTEEPSGARSTARFSVSKVRGQWRISRLPSDFGLWMTKDQFSRIFQPQEIYYPSATGHTLVPDTQWYPQTGLVSSLAAAVVRGAPAWMRGMTMTPLPAGSRLSGPSVSIDSAGIASVSVSQQVLRATTAQRTALWASMLATLGQVSEVRRVEVVLADGARLQSTNVPRSPSTPADVGYSAASGAPGAPVARTGAGRLEWMDPSATTTNLHNKPQHKTLPNLPAIGRNWPHVAVSEDGRQVAAIDGASSSLGRWVGGRLTILRSFGTALVGPSFSGGGESHGAPEIWVAGAATGRDEDAKTNSTVWVLDASLAGEESQPQPVDASWLRSLRIRAIRVSPDGQRIAVAAQTRAGASRLYVAGIVRDRKGHAQALTRPDRIAPRAGEVLDVGWLDYVTLAVLRRGANGTVGALSAPVGGLSSDLGATPGGLSLAATGAGLNAVYVTTDSNTVLTRIGATWQRVTGAVGVIAAGS